MQLHFTTLKEKPVVNKEEPIVDIKEGPRRITIKLQSKGRNLNKTSLHLALKNLCTSSQKKMHGIPSKLHSKPRVLIFMQGGSQSMWPSFIWGLFNIV